MLIFPYRVRIQSIKREYFNGCFLFLIFLLIGLYGLCQQPFNIHKSCKTVGYLECVDTTNNVISCIDERELTLGQKSCFLLQETDFSIVYDYFQKSTDSIKVKVWYPLDIQNYDCCHKTIYQLQLDDTLIIEYSWWRKNLGYIFVFLFGFGGLVYMKVFRKRVIRIIKKHQRIIRFVLSEKRNSFSR